MNLKRIFCGLLSAALLAGYAFAPEALPLTENAVVTAKAAESEDFKYKVYYDQAVITAYYGNKTDVEIPQTIDGHKVVKLSGTFNGNQNIETVKIPEGVKIIGERTFFECPNLKSVSFPKTLTKVDEAAFYNCERLKKADLPDSVKEMGDYVFSGCVRLESVNIPAGLKKIGREAFFKCLSLLRADIPDSITKIEDGAFMYCSKISRVNLPEGLQSVGDHAFSGCTRITDIAIPSTLTHIKNVFENCIELKNVYIPKTVKEISNRAFLYCEKIVIYGEEGSYAETYASNRHFGFKAENPPASRPVTPSFFKAVKKSDGEAKISWAACGNADGYELYMSSTKDGEFIMIKDITDYLKKSFVRSELTPEKTYYFKLRAYRTEGKKKLYSGYTPVVKIKV